VSTSEKRSIAGNNAGSGNQSSGGGGTHARNAHEAEQANADNKAKGRAGREAGLRNADQEMPKGGDAGGRMGSGNANK